MDFTVKNVTDRLGNEFLKVMMTKTDGTVATRTLTVDQFCKILRQSQEQSLDFNEWKKDFFPKDTLYAKIADYKNYDVVWAEKPGKRCFVYRDEHFFIPFPDLIFAISVRKGNVTSKYCYARKKSDKKGLYKYPFGNVSSDGSICMGNISLKDIEHADDFAEEFYLGVTNDDYYQVGGKVKPKYTQRQLLEKLSKLEAFPERWLIKHETFNLNELIDDYRVKAS